MNKNNWTYKKLKDISTKICDGDWIESKDQSPEGIRLIQTGNIGNGIFKDKEDKSRFISEETFERLKCTEIFPGDILVSRLPDPIGRSCILPNIDGRMITAVDCAIVRLSDECLPKYYVHYTQSNRYATDIINFTTGSTRKRISRKNLESLLIPVPSKETQLSIVKELDSLNDSITMLQQQVKDLDNLAQSIFYEMFGDPISNPKSWPTNRMEKVAPCTAYKGTIKPIEGKYWLLNLDMIESQTGKILDKYLCNESEIGNSTSCFSEENVLYSKLRPYLNKVVLPNEKGYCTSELLPLLPQKECLNRVFLALLLRCNSFVNYINNRVAGAKMPRVSMNDSRSFNVILPPISLQQSFASQIESIEDSKASINSQISEMQTLLASRMQYWFD